MDVVRLKRRIFMWKKKEREMGEEPKKGKLPKRAKIAVAGVAAAAAVGILLSDSF